MTCGLKWQSNIESGLFRGNIIKRMFLTDGGSKISRPYVRRLAGIKCRCQNPLNLACMNKSEKNVVSAANRFGTIEVGAT